MKVSQIFEIVNGITSEITGKTDLVQEDLSNIVDVGTEIFSTDNAVDNYVKKLVDRIGKVVFVNRKYSGNVPTMLKDSWEYGSVLEKITADIPEATENETWGLVDKQEYKQDIFYQPKVSTKFFNKKITFEIPMSFTERQVKESFISATQLNAFMSMIYTAIDNSLTVKIDSLIMRTINSMIAQTIHSEFNSTDPATTTGIKAVNLLKLYNDKTKEKLTPSDCLTNAGFIRFATYTMNLYKDRLGKMSTLFNCGKKERFTPKDKLGIVLLSEFKSGASSYLESDTFHNELVKLPDCETVPYWQGSGTDYSFEKTSTINVKLDPSTTVTLSGIIGIMYDMDSMGVCNTDRRVTTNYNAKAEFFTNYYKFDAGYYNDLNENFVVFYVGNSPAL